MGVSGLFHCVAFFNGAAVRLPYSIQSTIVVVNAWCPSYQEWRSNLATPVMFSTNKNAEGQQRGAILYLKDY